MTDSLSRITHHRNDRELFLKEFLISAAGLSESKVEELFDFGAIYTDGKRTREDLPLKGGELIRIHHYPKRYPTSELKIVFENEDLIAIDKPSGLPTHPTLDNYLENAWTLLQKARNEKLFVTHRLDIPTEGILIFAKTPGAQAWFNKMLTKRKVKKIYRAITAAAPTIGHYEHFMDIDARPAKKIYSELRDGLLRVAMTIEKVWKIEEGFACEINLETGRTHQIRAQLAHLGMPILGDRLYGSDSIFKKHVPERLALECFHMSFAHRSGTIGIYRPTPLVAPHSTKDS